MLRKILLAVDGSEGGVAAARFLSRLPFPSGTRIQVLCVVDMYAQSVSEMAGKAHRHHARHAVHDAAAIVRREGLQVECDLRAGVADEQILLAARELSADLVVLGSRGLSDLKAFLLGSVARNVASQAPCPVLVVRGERARVRQVIFAADGSPLSQKAVEFTMVLPLPPDSHVTAVDVLTPLNPPAGLWSSDEEEDLRLSTRLEERRNAAEALLNDVCRRLEASGKHAWPDVRLGDPANEIVDLAQHRDADLIVAGARGVSLIEGMLVGSVADRLLKHAPCPVLLVR